MAFATQAPNRNRTHRLPMLPVQGGGFHGGGPGGRRDRRRDTLSYDDTFNIPGQPPIPPDTQTKPGPVVVTDPPTAFPPPGGNPGQGPYATNGWLFDPGSDYGGTFGQNTFPDTPVGEDYLQNNPAAAWQRYTAQKGIDPLSNRGGVARTLLGRVNDAYEAALATNPLLRRQDFLRGIDPNQIMDLMTPAERGERPGLFSGRARTISRGYGG